MMNDVFAECRERVPASAAAERYAGLQIQRGMCRCCFHDEKTPSMHFSENGTFYCHGCHTGGSSIDFTMKYFGLTALEAVRRLNADFNLQLPLDRPQNPQERAVMQHRDYVRRAQIAFEGWRRDMIAQICDCLRVYHKLIYGCCTKSTWADFAEAELLALQNGAQLENICVVLECGLLDEQMQIFDRREEVESLCRQILKPSADTQIK